MQGKILAGEVIFGLFAIGGAPANASLVCAGSGATLCVGLQESGVHGGAITTEDVEQPYPGVYLNNLTYGSFTINNASASDTGWGFGFIDFDSNTRDISSSANSTLKVYFTEVNVSAPILADYLSALTENHLQAGWMATLSTWIDASNTPYALTTQLQQETFSAIGADQTTGSFDLSGLYSVTEVFQITSGPMVTRAGDNSTIHLSMAAVPEPATWGMLLLGFVGLGARFGVRGRKPRLAPALS
jgi:PEP-CTERM motif